MTVIRIRVVRTWEVSDTVDVLAPTAEEALRAFIAGGWPDQMDLDPVDADQDDDVVVLGPVDDDPDLVLTPRGLVSVQEFSTEEVEAMRARPTQAEQEAEGQGRLFTGAVAPEGRKALVDVTVEALYASGAGGTAPKRTRRRGKEAAAVPPTGGAGT